MSTLRCNNITDTSGGSSSLSVPGAAKAWVNFNGTGTVAIRAQMNVSSITDNGTGNYTANFTTAMTDSNYVIVGTSSTDAGAIGVFTAAPGSTDFSKSTSAVTFATINTNASALRDYNSVNVSIFR